ncbi:cell division protein FtsQ/DivIB [Vogesella sp. LYT5W]|uniref:Cell division protein FtsQ n=1 Tax=Vogesella margarita TaxID=2984199 RepID=A0ABT5ILA3_9NEIS|nr:cell division protein FtsQ/DivIB [Vogesella margarita]MDC7713341.1 cell division protein FtsQ/DivIB [Vogesella margarita]
MWDNHAVLRALANMLLLAALLMLLYSAGVWLTHSPLFPVKRIAIGGQFVKVTPVQLKYIAKHELSGTFFTLDISKTRAAFEKLPWVREAQVRRTWPDSLQITIAEHVAVARWGENGLISKEGRWFDAASDQPLPVLFGPAGSEKEMVQALHTFGSVLGQARLKVRQLWLSERRAWKMELDNGVMLELGRGPVKERLARFVEYWPRSLANMPYRIEYIDLRYPNGFAVKMPDYKAASTATANKL